MIGRITSLFAATLVLAAGCAPQEGTASQDRAAPQKGTEPATPGPSDRPGPSGRPFPSGGSSSMGPFDDPPPPRPRATGLPAEPPLWTACPPPPEPDLGFVDGSDALRLPKLDDTFRPVSARVCTIGSRKRAGGGYDRVAIEQRVTDISTLLPALRRPDETPFDGGCTLEGHLVPWLVLLDAQGRYVRPGVPVDGCRKPRREFEATIRELPSTTVTVKVLGKLTN